MSRFSEKPVTYEPKISINTTYSNLLSQNNFETQSQVSIATQNVTGQPLMKNIIQSPTVTYAAPTHTTAPVIVAPPILLNVPPPQVLQTQMSATLVTPTPANNVLINTTGVVATLQPGTILTTENIQPTVSQPQNAIGLATPCVASVELASIPPPNPIQVHNIPQPEPINTLTIPPPAPIQVQNIPPPSPIQLNEIPNPKPLDLMNIPTPNDCSEKGISDPDFIKNIPPPNKSVPPPSLSESGMNINIGLPPPPSNISTVSAQLSTCIPPPNVLPPTSLPPPPQTVQQNIALQSIPPPQNVLVHSVPPPQSLQPNLTQLGAVANLPLPTTQSLATIQSLPPPPPSQTTTISVTIPLQNQLQVGVLQPAAVAGTNTIPSLMAQPVLPPPGMGLAPPHININCPPPTMQTPPPAFVTQPPPLTNQMPPMNVPPPAPPPVAIPTAVATDGSYRDLNAGNN